MTTGDIRIKEYKDRGEYEKDAPRMAAEGWRVVTVTEQTQRTGCLRMVTLGFFSLIWKPKPHLVVTYQR